MRNTRLFFRYFLISLILFCGALRTVAQEDAVFTNHQLRIPYTNPAYIPEILKATITVGGRFQWNGLEGAPRTLFASAKYFFIGAHSQATISIYSDKIGYQYTNIPKIGYAFMVPFGEDCYMNFGVGGGFVNRGYDIDKVTMVNTQNPEIIDKLAKGTAPDAEAGLELLIQNFELGASVNHLIPGTGEMKQSMLYSGYLNYLFQTKEWWRLIASYNLYNYRDRWKHQISVYFNYVFDFEFKPKDLFYVGVAYRPVYEGSVMLGINFTKWLSLFYSYDYFFGSLRHNSYGTHEVGLEFKIPQKFKGCFANYGKSHKYTRYTRIK